MPVDPYDVVAYDGSARPSTHPARILATARLLGRRTAEVDALRVLELGCGNGANLLPMASDLRDASFVGIDLAAAPIDRARRAAHELALGNVEFRVADLRDLPPDVGGEFDVVIAHGVYSWVPRDARDGLMRLLHERLHPDGVAFVSYNTYPGSYVRDAIRDILAYSVGTATDPAERLGAAREVLELLAITGGADAHGQAIATYAGDLLRRPDWLLYHDELAPICQPVYLYEFVEHAAAHDLAYLFEAHLAHGKLAGLPPAAADQLQRLGHDVVGREQHLDFVVNRLFRESLLVHAPVDATRTVDVAGIRNMHVHGQFERIDERTLRAADGTQVSFEQPEIGAALDLVTAAAPHSVPVEHLDLGAGDVVAAALVDLHVRRHLEVRCSPVRATGADVELPHVDELVRWQVRQGRERVTTSLHVEVAIADQHARHLLTLLDGTRDRGALCRAMDLDDPAPLLDALERFASVALLTTP